MMGIIRIQAYPKKKETVCMKKLFLKMKNLLNGQTQMKINRPLLTEGGFLLFKLQTLGGVIMRKAKDLTFTAYVEIDGETKLWYEVDANGNVTWHLPKDVTQKLRDKMLENTGYRMSDYINNHPEATLWGATNDYEDKSKE